MGSAARGVHEHSQRLNRTMMLIGYAQDATDGTAEEQLVALRQPSEEGNTAMAVETSVKAKLLTGRT